MVITIAGYGFVGKTYAAALEDHYTVQIVDPVISDTKVYEQIQDGVIICVSTPQGVDGACDFSNVHDVIDDTPCTIPILIKSTISIEAWDYLAESFPKHRLTFSPEFLREASALDDFLNAEQILIGGGDIEFWKNLFEAAFPDKYISIAEPRELILAKYFINSFLATKVSFFNQVYDLCAATNTDYKSVVDTITHDTRIGNSHTVITAERGFGGHCFPKDTEAIIYSAKQYDVELSVIAASNTYNKTIRKSN